MRQKKAFICAFAVTVVLLMVLSTIPSTVGEAEPRESRSDVFEIGTDIMELPAPGVKTGLFLPFIKHEYNYAPGSSGLFLYRASILQSYGMDEAGQITRISFMNMWGGQIYNHPVAGSQFIPGVSSFLNFRIKIGTTTRINAVASHPLHYDVSGPVTVYSRPGWSQIMGTHMNWMDFPFDTPFDWDGVSNLVIEYNWDHISGYNLGANFGGSWTGGYARLNGNLMSGIFKTGYSPISWYAFDVNGVYYKYVYGPPDDNLPVLQIEGQFGIPATVRMEPQALNLESMGNYVNVKVLGFPENPEYTPLDVADDTCEVEGIGCELKYATYNDGKYITKCDRLLVEDAIGAPGAEIEMEVTGELNDGTTFKGIATFKAILNNP